MGRTGPAIQAPTPIHHVPFTITQIPVCYATNSDIKLFNFACNIHLFKWSNGGRGDNGSSGISYCVRSESQWKHFQRVGIYPPPPHPPRIYAYSYNIRGAMQLLYFCNQFWNQQIYWNQEILPKTQNYATNIGEILNTILIGYWQMGWCCYFF